MLVTEPTMPLIFHAQPGGTFSFMGCFMNQYPKQILTISQQVQSYIGVVSLTAMNLPTDWKAHFRLSAECYDKHFAIFIVSSKENKTVYFQTAPFCVQHPLPNPKNSSFFHCFIVYLSKVCANVCNINKRRRT